jgi:hypothetical protein
MGVTQITLHRALFIEDGKKTKAMVRINYIERSGWARIVHFQYRRNKLEVVHAFLLSSYLALPPPILRKLALAVLYLLHEKEYKDGCHSGCG